MGADEFAGLTAMTDLRTSKLNARQKDHVRELRRKGGSKCSKQTMDKQGYQGFSVMQQEASDPPDSSLYPVGTQFFKPFETSDGTIKLYQGTVIGIKERKPYDWLKVSYLSDEDEEEINTRDFRDLINLYGRVDMAADGTGGDRPTSQLGDRKKGGSSVMSTMPKWVQDAAQQQMIKDAQKAAEIAETARSRNARTCSREEGAAPASDHSQLS